MVTVTQTTTTVRPNTKSTPKLYSPKHNLLLSIDNQWYDLTQWQHIHPGGSEILTHLNGADATDAFYSLHSQQAIERLKRLPTVQADRVVDVNLKPPTAATVAFRQLRQQLEAEGWFKKCVPWEVFNQSSVYILAALGTWFALFTEQTVLNQCLSILCLGLSQSQAGWVGHDYQHSRGSYAWYSARLISGLINAFSPAWWSNKHNTHHVYTNHIGIDIDIANHPVIHLLYPESDKDVRFRPFQHIFYLPVYSLLFVSWRSQSFQYAAMAGRGWELLAMMVNYTWLYLLGWKISIASLLLAGWISALIVTATHQSEEMYTEQSSPLKHYSFVECQFETTRDVRTDNPIMAWLWGGMQYQLEHHLFPTMPRYYYFKLTERVKKFAADNGLCYRCDSVGQILYRNYETIKKYAGSPPNQDSKKHN